MSGSPSVLLVTRDLFTADPVMPTLGIAEADGLEGPVFTLEDPWRDNHPGTSCIPEGDYQLVYTMSARLKHWTPRLLNVPERSGVLIHKGNTDADTVGCILVGRTRNPGGRSISNCDLAYNAVVRWLLKALAAGPAVCRITRGTPDA